MWYLGIWFSGGLNSGRLMVGLCDLKGPFQPKLFYSVICGPADLPRTLPGLFNHKCLGLKRDWRLKVFIQTIACVV